MSLTTHIVIMGVSGCGKTTLGEGLAKALGWPFFDADDFHPPSNVAKMKAGIALDDEDRSPWLLQLNTLLQTNPHAALACSALKEKYRAVLKTNLPNLRFIHPHGSFKLIASRIENRAKKTGHYMPLSLLQSQFETLEPCIDALMVGIDMSRQERLAFVLKTLNKLDSLTKTTHH